ncbi:MAG: Type 1 glutamine amidotransferase-like domain-containing protein [Anaerolineales bacterium]|nr:Type 1 glutamine amidotransferase-like domain-containing protein [Anaerolineales bacterium]
MPANSHLFSTPGENDIRYIVEACRSYLEDKDHAKIAYMPLASLDGERWLDYTRQQFKGLAQVQMLDTELMAQKELESALRECQVAYIPGGNTFLLAHRLHLSGIMPFLKKRVQAGWPVIGFSAGAILCGPNILTSSDMNAVKTDHFGGLNATPFNFFAHYAPDAFGQAQQDEWLSDYHVFHDNPVVLLCDGAYVKVEKGKATLARGEACIQRKGVEKERLEEGQPIIV